MTLTNVGTVGRLKRVIHAPHFLLVSDEMLYGRHDALFLNTVDVMVSIDSHTTSLLVETRTKFEPARTYPWIVYLAPTASNTGSAPKPSQLRPSRGFRPRGPTVGPR